MKTPQQIAQRYCDLCLDRDEKTMYYMMAANEEDSISLELEIDRIDREIARLENDPSLVPFIELEMSLRTEFDRHMTLLEKVYGNIPKTIADFWQRSGA